MLQDLAILAELEDVEGHDALGAATGSPPGQEGREVIVVVERARFGIVEKLGDEPREGQPGDIRADLAPLSLLLQLPLVGPSPDQCLFSRWEGLGYLGYGATLTCAV